MADISLKLKHNLECEEAKRRIQKKIDKSAGDFKLRMCWDNNVCHLSGPATGNIRIGENTVEVELKLGLAAKMFRSTIESKLEHSLKNILS